MGRDVYRRRKRGRPRTSWLADVLEDFIRMGVWGYAEVAVDTRRWIRLVLEAGAHVEL